MLVPVLPIITHLYYTKGPGINNHLALLPCAQNKPVSAQFVSSLEPGKVKAKSPKLPMSSLAHVTWAYFLSKRSSWPYTLKLLVQILISCWLILDYGNPLTGTWPWPTPATTPGWRIPGRPAATKTSRASPSKEASPTGPPGTPLKEVRFSITQRSLGWY